MTRIGLLSDIHGNVTALRAIIEDAQKQGVDEFWVLGDVFMPGPGTQAIFDLLDSVNTTSYVMGNWDDALLASLRGEIDLGDSTDVYGLVLSLYAQAGLGDVGIARIAAWPMTVTRQVEGLSVGASHNLPDNPGGNDLITSAPPANFDRLFAEGINVAVMGHTHSPLLRHSRKGLVINPGSAGLPGWFDENERLSRDLRGHYAILAISDHGIDQADFRTVAFDVDAELALARRQELPYYELYEQQLTTGVAQTHNRALLDEINQRCGYLDLAREFLRRSVGGQDLFRGSPAPI